MKNTILFMVRFICPFPKIRKRIKEKIDKDFQSELHKALIEYRNSDEYKEMLARFQKEEEDRLRKEEEKRQQERENHLKETERWLAVINENDRANYLYTLRIMDATANCFLH